MSIYKKLQTARIELQGIKLEKSGHNKFAGFKYFELGDFLPTIQKICDKHGLCGTVSFTNDMAYLTIYDVEGDSSAFVTFTSPMSSAQLKGCHDVQNLGAVQTYLRRYLWVNAFEIVEHDAIDPTVGEEEPKKKYEPPKTVKGKAGEWQMIVSDDGAWNEAVKAGTNTLLKLVKSADDVNNIYRVNKVIFDKLKEEHPNSYDEIMELFKEVKSKF